MIKRRVLDERRSLSTNVQDENCVPDDDGGDYDKKQERFKEREKQGLTFGEHLPTTPWHCHSTLSSLQHIKVWEPCQAWEHPASHFYSHSRGAGRANRESLTFGRAAVCPVWEDLRWSLFKESFALFLTLSSSIPPTPNPTPLPAPSLFPSLLSLSALPIVSH